MTTIDHFRYLWDGSDDRWVLLKSTRSAIPVIFNTADRTALIVEDDDVYRQVVSKMIAAGKEVLDQIPS